MTLPRQNSAWVDGDGRPTRDLYNWARSVSAPAPVAGETVTTLGGLDNVAISGIEDGDALVWSDNQGKWVNSPSSLTSANASLSAAVNLTVTGTWYDGPSVSLTAGTWLVVAHASFSRTTAVATTWEARIYDGSTAYASSNRFTPATANTASGLSLQAIVTLTGSATMTLQATTNAGATACLMRDTTFVNGISNATRISAVKLA